MLKRKWFLLLLFIVIVTLTIVFNQSPLKATPGDWTLAWSDEFTGADGSAIDSGKWGFRTDNGWSASQVAAYTDRIRNCYIQNNMCVIKAMKEAYAGNQYTSARISTLGKFDFTYGKIEMSAKLPYSQGMWPSFWLLGSNISSAPWPNCGEIDVMNNIGREPDIIRSSIFGPGFPTGYGTAYTLPGGTQFKDGFHTFTVEWEPNVIRWYCDGNLYDTRNPGDVSPNSWPFDKSFNLYVNFDVGGNWPGNPDNTTIFPQYFTIDYIRVYQREGGVYPTPTPIKIEAENYSAMSGVQTEKTGDTGGGLNVGWIDTGDWMDYPVKIPTNSLYRVDYRIASPNNTGKVGFQIGGATLATSIISNTGGWQTWKTVSSFINLNQGFQTIRLLASGGGWNFNWFSLNPVTSTPTPSSTPTPTPFIAPGRIEAENYQAMSGVQTEATSDTGGGLNVGWIDTGDWMEYPVDFQIAGNVQMELRVASINSTGKIDVFIDGVLSGTVSVINTGGWQTWYTATCYCSPCSLGLHTVRISANTGGWNINWFSIYIQYLKRTYLTPIYPPGSNEFYISSNSTGYTRIIMKLTDEAGNGIPGQTITFENKFMGMQYLFLSSSTSITDNYGIASVNASVPPLEWPIQIHDSITVRYNGSAEYANTNCQANVYLYNQPAPTPTPVETWMPYLPTAQQVTLIPARESSMMYVDLTFPDNGYRVADPGQVATAAGINPDGTTRNTNITMGTKIERFTGISTPSPTTIRIPYQIGYGFTTTFYFNVNYNGQDQAVKDITINPVISLLSQGKTASASSFQTGNEVYKGNDGNTSTRWSASGSSFPQWWMVDLLNIRQLSSVDINWYNGASRAYKYKIEVSTDNFNFSTIVDKTGNTTIGNTSDNFSASGRFIRITITGASAGWASFYELGVYGYEFPFATAPLFPSLSMLSDEY